MSARFLQEITACLALWSYMMQPVERGSAEAKCRRKNDPPVFRQLLSVDISIYFDVSCKVAKRMGRLCAHKHTHSSTSKMNEDGPISCCSCLLSLDQFNLLEGICLSGWIYVRGVRLSLWKSLQNR